MKVMVFVLLIAVSIINNSESFLFEDSFVRCVLCVRIFEEIRCESRIILAEAITEQSALFKFLSFRAVRMMKKPLGIACDTILQSRFKTTLLNLNMLSLLLYCIVTCWIYM